MTTVPPKSEQIIKKAMNECFQNAVNVNEGFQITIQPSAYEASVQLTVKKAACGYQDFAESTAIKDANAFAVEDATLFYILNIKTTKREKTDKSDYAKIKYSMADWRL